VSERLRSVMVECAELARAGRLPAPFHGCAHGAGGGPAMGVLQPPVALAPRARVAAAPASAAPIIVYDRDTPLGGTASTARPTREHRPQATPRYPATMRRVA
jgi:hypothetical protein